MVQRSIQLNGLLELLTIHVRLSIINLKCLHPRLTVQTISCIAQVSKGALSRSKLYATIQDLLTVDPKIMKDAKSNMILIHLLPRNTKVSPKIGDDARTTYFRQVSLPGSQGGSLYMIPQLTGHR